MRTLQAFVKTPEEIAAMRVAGRQAASVLEMIAPHVKTGVSTETLDQICHDYIVNTLNATPAPLNYRGFPKSICTSINQVVCHGIPSNKKLKDGDIINIDVTVIVDGFHGDTSRMFLIGAVKPEHQRLVKVAHEALWTGIRLVKPGVSLRSIGKAIEDYAHSQHTSSVRDFCGHGIGREFHEQGFQVLHYDAPENEQAILLPGLTFTIEPMINLGGWQTRLLGDGWTAVTKDRSYSAQYEHTLAVTEDGVEVLTLRSDERASL